MTTDDIILHIFCLVDDSLPNIPRHSQAKLYPSELVTKRTRLQRLLKTHQDGCQLLLADPTFFTVIDSYPIELIFPIRQGRSPQQVGKKGRDKGRWSVGIKFCWLLNDFCRVVAGIWMGLGQRPKGVDFSFRY